MLSLVLVALLASTRATAEFLSLLDTYGNVTEWFWQTGVVAGDKLYIDGGEYYNRANISDTIVSNAQLSATLVIDISQSWTNATVTGTWYEHDQIDIARRPNLWYNTDDKRVYRWGGWPYEADTSYPSQLWSFAASDASVGWDTAAYLTENGANTESFAPFGGASAVTDNAFYSLGGENTTYNLAVAGLAKYDFSTQRWLNISSEGATTSGWLVQGQSAFAPNFGDEGFLVYVGGDLPETQPYGYMVAGYETGLDLADMATVTLYDVANQKWYQQKTTGDIPPPRSEFCAVGVASEDKLTFELFIYGGSTNSTYDSNHPSAPGYLEVYALSLPGFVWLKSPSTTPVRRANHHCVTLGSSQFLSIGGRQPASLAQFGSDEDPWLNGLGVFDMNAFAWADFYNAGAGAYVGSDVVKGYYNSSSYVTPTFSDPVLASAFKFSGATATATATAGSGSHAHSSTAAIIGGIVGGVVVLLLVVGGGVFFCLRRQRRANRDRDEATKLTALQHNSPYAHLHGNAVEAPTQREQVVRFEKDAWSPNPQAEFAGGRNRWSGSGIGIGKGRIGGRSSTAGLVELPGS